MRVRNWGMRILALFDDLQVKMYRYDLRLDAKGQICSLIFANNESIDQRRVNHQLSLFMKIDRILVRSNLNHHPSSGQFVH